MKILKLPEIFVSKLTKFELSYILSLNEFDLSKDILVQNNLKELIVTYKQGEE